MTTAAAARPDADLIRTLEGAHYHPLWDRYKRITPIAPRDRDAPMHWRWRDFEPLAARAAKEVPIEDVERRAIICVNPAFAGETVKEFAPATGGGRGGSSFGGLVTLHLGLRYPDVFRRLAVVSPNAHADDSGSDDSHECPPGT